MKPLFALTAAGLLFIGPYLSHPKPATPRTTTNAISHGAQVESTVTAPVALPAASNPSAQPAETTEVVATTKADVPAGEWRKERRAGFTYYSVRQADGLFGNPVACASGTCRVPYGDVRYWYPAQKQAAQSTQRRTYKRRGLFGRWR